MHSMENRWTSNCVGSLNRAITNCVGEIRTLRWIIGQCQHYSHKCICALCCSDAYRRQSLMLSKRKVFNNGRQRPGDSGCSLVDLRSTP